MRDYGKIYSSFWTGPTGKLLRGNLEAQVVATYLFSNKHANMIGLYYLPIMYLCYETGLSEKGATKGLQRLIEADFCSYDKDAEVVWVHEMAKWQVADSLKPTDKQCIGIQTQYESLPKCLFLQAFYEKYKDAFHLSKCRENGSPLPSPLEGTPKPGAGTGAGEEKKINKKKEALVFEKFWGLYPRQVKKKSALAEWETHIDDDDQLAASVIAALQAQLHERAIKSQCGVSFIAEWQDPERWIKNHRWTDSVMTEEQIRAQAPKPKPAAFDFKNPPVPEKTPADVAFQSVQQAFNRRDSNPDEFDFVDSKTRTVVETIGGWPVVFKRYVSDGKNLERDFKFNYGAAA